MNIAEHVSMDDFHIWDVAVSNPNLTIPGTVSLRVTMVVGRDRVEIMRDMTWPREAFRHLPDSEIARMVYEFVRETLEHEITEKFRFKGRPMFNPHPEDPSYANMNPWDDGR